ncbi:MAG: thioredoxin domain-containing protein [Cyanobacteriota bacterium]|nr:thioredoxin domain-containing protein [Cyanobacteriota bacterium]
MSQATATQILDLDRLLQDGGLIVMDCWASWCGPCQVVRSLVEQLSDEYGDRIQTIQLDVEENKEFVKKIGLRSIPAVLIFQDGELVESVVGLAPYSRFAHLVERHL